MSAVRGRGNRSTEWKVRAVLIRSGVRGWRLHSKQLPGRPDFVFPDRKIAVFVDGCFWHACPKCGRTPKSHSEFWKAKIAGNARRDKRHRVKLKRLGWRVFRLWEHDLQKCGWVSRLWKLLMPRNVRPVVGLDRLISRIHLVSLL